MTLIVTTDRYLTKDIKASFEGYLRIQSMAAQNERKLKRFTLDIKTCSTLSCRLAHTHNFKRKKKDCNLVNP